ncbi:MAG: ribbon-helix-helix domain-containing protein [Angustibacter sp.]
MSYGNFQSGDPITEEHIAAWVTEAEAGYDVTTLARRGRPRLGPGASTVVPVRLDPELLAALRLRAEESQESRSNIIRAALRDFLASA